jgi:16S rRNA (cytidine1402-2'-O)-methyltransferase
MGNLYLVATPIGNLEDFSLRAIRILKTVDLIIAEDTRTSLKLLNHYQIKNKLESFHQHSSEKRLLKLIDDLRIGKNLALLSEAGTPNISDPGSKLISYIREKLSDEVKIIPIPGASALTSILSISPWSVDKFIFFGFLAHKKGRQSQLKEIINFPYLVVLYESKHRLLKLLKELNSLEKEYNKEIELMIGRELTKKFEQVIFGGPNELIDKFQNNSHILKGEFVLILKIKNK